MTLIPVVSRELRAESRRPFNYGLRVIGVLALLAACGLSFYQHASYRAMVQQVLQYAQSGWGQSSPGGGSANTPELMGTLLFGYANTALFSTLWLLLPLLTADSINREKREGTLGLLFLTPLTPMGVVSGKCFVHGLRGLTLFLTMLPILAMPVLLGGVSSADVLMAFLVDASAFLLALSAGLLASCLVKDPVRTVILAETLSLILCMAFVWAHRTAFDAIGGGTVLNASTGGRTWVALTHPSTGVISWFTSLFAFSTNMPRTLGAQYWGFVPAPIGSWSTFWANAGPDVQQLWFFAVASLLAASAAVFTGIMMLASRVIRRTWREEPPSARRLALEKTYLSQRFMVDRFRRRRGAVLDRNPSAWLQQYSVTARLTKWGWCLFILLAECVFVNGWQEMLGAQTYLAVALLGGMGFAAAASFRQEHETGALELLLVTPLRVPQIIAGRRFGLWMQFLPSVALLWLAWMFSDLFLNWQSYWDRNSSTSAVGPWILLGTWVTLPSVGMYFSMTRPSLLHAWLLTCLVGIGVPYLAQLSMAMPGYLVFEEQPTTGETVFRIMAAQTLLAIAGHLLLRRYLRRISATGLSSFRRVMGHGEAG